MSKLATVGLKKKKSDGLFLVLVGLNLKDETYQRSENISWLLLDTDQKRNNKRCAETQEENGANWEIWSLIRWVAILF